MKKRTILLSIAALVAVFAAGSTFVSPALTSPVRQMFTVNKPGMPAKQIEGRKDTFSNVPAPPQYRTTFGAWSGEPAEWAELKKAVRQSFDLEREAMLVANAEKGAEYKKRFADVFSNRSGELDKRRGFIDNNKGASDGLGIVVKESGVSKLEFRQIEVDGTQATVIADAWTFSVYDQTKETDPAKRLQRAENAAQHTMTLVLEDGKWKLAEDKVAYLPGQSPAGP